LTRLQELETEAQAEFHRGELTKAATDLQKAICLSPGSARLYYELGMTEEAAHNFSEARDALEHANRLQPDNVLPAIMLVRVYLAMDEVGRAKETLGAVAKWFPGNGELHARLARELIGRQQFDLALAESLRAEKSGHNDPEDTVALAVLENQAGAYADAIRLAEAVEKKSTISDNIRASAAAIAGLSWDSLGQPEEATRHLRLAIQLAPSEENSYLSLAKVYEKAQKYEDAADVLRRASKQVPNSPNLRLTLGADLVAADENREGAQVLAELLQEFPDTLDAYKQLAEAHRKMGHAELSTETLRRLAKRETDYPTLHVLLAQSLLAEDDVNYPTVLEELALAEKDAPTDFNIYYLKGKVCAVLDRYQDAVVALRRAIELQPTDSSPYYQLGLAYQKLGQTALAKEQFERVEHLKRTPAKP
jgi:tetratricopeptide (TPR) repeat protein